MDIDEVEADDPRPWPEDHRCLLGEEVIDDSFQFIRRNGMKLCKRVVVGVRPTSSVGNSLDGLLIDGCLSNRFPDDPGVEDCGFDSGERKFLQKADR
ncbi:hypothetical protein [Halorubrum sp. F4]|uniref:hypothetical protein n=1 Tax=Halorubrum sp. F4 TaxID=2989715 RepID=UPI002481136B|nr:hypothetical protein [Halorubrum sp. F4]